MLDSDLITLVSSSPPPPPTSSQVPPQKKRTWDEAGTPNMEASPFSPPDSTSSGSTYDYQPSGSSSTSAAPSDAGNHCPSGQFNLDPLLNMPAAQAGGSNDFDFLGLTSPDSAPIDFGVTDASTMNVINDMWAQAPLQFKYVHSRKSNYTLLTKELTVLECGDCTRGTMEVLIHRNSSLSLSPNSQGGKANLTCV